MNSSCPDCLAVAESGRIRLTEDGARIQIELLLAERRRLMDVRRRSIANESWELLADANARMKTVIKMLEEVTRTRAEMGWPDDQPQLAHS